MTYVSQLYHLFITVLLVMRKPGSGGAVCLVPAPTPGELRSPRR